MKKYLGIIVLSILCIICTIMLFSEIISFNNPSKESNAKVFEDKAIKVNNNVIDINYKDIDVSLNNINSYVGNISHDKVLDYLVNNNKSIKMYDKNNGKILEFNVDKKIIDGLFGGLDISSNSALVKIYFSSNEKDIADSIYNKVNREKIIRDNIIKTAKKQVGNTGEKYWTWYGYNRYVHWCCVFVSWVADQNNVLETAVPKFIWVKKGVDWYRERGLLKFPKEYTPKAADIIFFDWNNNGVIDHVGFVEKVENGYVYTIEGNVEYTWVKNKKYKLNSSYIYAYGAPKY